MVIIDMRRVALKVGYIGTDFYGFQRQPGLSTVEGELLSALKKIGLITEIGECGFGIAGRTDRGVHALSNVVSFLTEGEVIINQINDALPSSINVLAEARVPLHFKTRYAESRHYRYLMINDDDNFSDFKLDRMIEAAMIFKGTHNFLNFSKRSERNPVRTILEIRVVNDDDVIILDVIGESFLWNMIRKMVTVLLNVFNGELKPDRIYDYLDPENDVLIKPAPPEGLILMDVNYNGIVFHEDDYAKNKFISTLRKEYFYQQNIALSEKEMIKSLMR
jgi:tRNA pseudouridine38-40 synthase